MSLFRIFFTLTSFFIRHKQHLPQITNDFWRFFKTLLSAIWYLFLSYSFSDLEMKRSASLEKVNGAEIVSNVRKTNLPLKTREVSLIPEFTVRTVRTANSSGNERTADQTHPDEESLYESKQCRCLYRLNNTYNNVSKRKLRSAVGNVLEQYSITIQPKPCRSSSLSDLTNTSEFNFDFTKFSQPRTRQEPTFSFYDCSGDAVKNYVNELTELPCVSWTFRGKKPKNKAMSQSYGSKFATDYVAETMDTNFSSVENSSCCSTDQLSLQKGAVFPFESTPSGNLKVQSNQVVFQSSTVGVLLADPTQAKVKVKFEGKAAGEPDEETFRNYDNETEAQPQHQYCARDVKNSNFSNKNTDRQKIKLPGGREDKGKDLNSLGYALAEPIDWMRVQLPKKLDLFQEFFKRIHNYINTDTIVRIGDEEFHCHRIVLQIYSSFFDQNPLSEIELPTTNVTPESFQTVYEWMIFSGQESNKALKRDNILDMFCTAQYLAIKDLEDQCWSLIANENLFTEDTAFALFKEARLKGMTSVMDIMVPRVMRFFLPLVASKDFLTLEHEEVMTFLKSNYISVTSEIEVLMAGVRWLYGDWSNRRRDTVEIMRCIRFGLISPWQLVDIKRNPDNNEVLEIVNEPEVQQMVDDGLAYVIIKYWYGNNSKNYYHWIDVLGLSEPAERNWIGEEKDGSYKKALKLGRASCQFFSDLGLEELAFTYYNHVTYKDFLKYLEQFMVPREQMYQQMAMMQTTRRGDDVPGSMRAMDDKMEMRRPKMDFPFPPTLKGITGDKDKFPTMSEFFESRKKNTDHSQFSPRSRSPPIDEKRGVDPNMQSVFAERRRCVVSSESHQKQLEEQRRLLEQKQQLKNAQRRQLQQEIQMPNVLPENGSSTKEELYDPPEKDSEEMNTSIETSSGTVDSIEKQNMMNYFQNKSSEKRHSVAASYLATATAALAGSRRPSQPSTTRPQVAGPASRGETSPRSGPPKSSNVFSPQISLFNHSKDSLARINMNKLSTSILGPSNKNYILDGSLFNWNRETVLVFGGIDPHTSYGLGTNSGKEIFRFDPLNNVWESVGELPEPRHHHSVAFLRGRVYLVGGADPRDDDIRGKSVVVSTVWSYEPVTRSWFSESGLAVPRKNFGLVVHRMALYAIGGQDKRGRVLRSVEKFDPKTAAWSEVHSMSVARMAVAVTKYREYIWVAGGMTGEKKKPVCKIVECYNSDTNQWTEIHNLRFPRCFATLFSMNDKLYIIGGAGKVSDKDKTASSVGAIDVWHWETRQWQQETEMSMPRHGHALAYLGTQLIIIGGVTTIYMRALNNVESYCCERGAWIRGVSTLPSPLSGHGAVTLPPASLM